MNYCAIIDSPLGKLGIATSNHRLVKIDFVAASYPLLPPQNEFTAQIITQLNNYFSDPGYSFTIPMAIQGTDFQQRVWQALQAIPSGTTFTYGHLAKGLNTSPRAIGNACRTNPIPIIIPCHRIIGQSSLGGYSGCTKGDMMTIKHWLLHHEKRLLI